MADVEVTFERKITVKAPPEKVYEVLSDFSRVKKLVPSLQSFRKTGENRYHWKFKPAGAMGVEIAAEYETDFELEENKRIAWKSIPGKGNTDVEGEFKLKKKGSGTEVHLKVKTVAHLPIPRFARGIARPYVEKEITRVMDGYLENLKKTVEGS